MLNHLECFSIRHGDSNFYDLEFSKKVNLNKHPLLTDKIEKLSSKIKGDNLKFVLRDDGDVSISILKDGKYVIINQNELDKTAIKIIRSISEIAKNLKISSLKNEYFKPFKEVNVNTYHSFDHPKPSPKSSFSIKDFFSFFHKIFATHLVVKPTINKIIDRKFKNKSPDQIANMYINNQKLFSSIKDKIMNNSSSAYEAFQPEELETLINNTILELYEKRLNKITDKEIYKLDVSRIINSLTNHNLSKNEYKKLLSVSPLDIPIQELAKITVTPENEKLLSQIWAYLIGNLFAKGNLAKLYSANKDHQTQYAIAYIEARSKLPSLIHNKISGFINKLDNEQKIKNILYYSMQNSDIAQLKNRVPFSSEINLYNNKIKKEMDKFLNRASNRDGIKITENLVYNNKSTKIAEKIYADFTEEEELIFNKEDIRKLFFIALEKTAVEDYNITESQLKSYKVGREKASAKEISPKEQELYMFNESALESLEDKLGNQEIQAYKDLLFISKILDSAIKNVTPEDKERLEKILANIKNDSYIKKTINQYIVNKDVNYMNSILNMVPKFFHPFIHKIINPNNLPIEPKKIPYGISFESIEFLNNYIQTTDSISRSKEKLEKTQIKAENLLKKYESNSNPIRPNERLTVQELGSLSKSARYAIVFKKLISFKLDYAHVPMLQKTIEEIERSQTILTKIESIISPSLPNHYRSGDLLSYNSAKKEKWHSHSGTLEEKLTAFASNSSTHGGKLFKKNDDKIVVSHLLADVTRDKLDLYTMCISDIYEINIKPLISPQMQTTLKKYYGNQWNLHVNKLYVNAETELHRNAKKKFVDVENDRKKRTLAALADFPRLAKFLTGDQEIKGHKKADESSRLGVYNAFFGDGPKSDTQICSEWASKATLAAMMETNRILAADLAEKTGFGGSSILQNFDEHHVILPTDVREYLQGVRLWGNDREKTKEAERKLVSILKENNYSRDQIELIIRIGNKEIFNLPYDRRERLKAIHPGRMVSLLAEKNCLRKRELPPVLTQLIAAE